MNLTFAILCHSSNHLFLFFLNISSCLVWWRGVGAFSAGNLLVPFIFGLGFWFAFSGGRLVWNRGLLARGASFFPRRSRSPGGPASILWWAWCAFQRPSCIADRGVTPQNLGFGGRLFFLLFFFRRLGVRPCFFLEVKWKSKGTPFVGLNGNSRETTRLSWCRGPPFPFLEPNVAIIFHGNQQVAT